MKLQNEDFHAPEPHVNTEAKKLIFHPRTRKKGSNQDNDFLQTLHQLKSLGEIFNLPPGHLTNEFLRETNSSLASMPQQLVSLLLHYAPPAERRLVSLNGKSFTHTLFQTQTECDNSCSSVHDTSGTDICTVESEVDTYNCTEIGYDSPKKWDFQKKEDSQIMNEEKEDNFSPCKKADAENDDFTCGNHSNDYIYDEQTKMYYSVSTGYYYDVNTELFYVPQTGSYYKYDYSENKYELVKNTKGICDSSLIHTCESVVDKVDNLNINDDVISSCFENEESSPEEKGYIGSFR
ncbi:hypothetical protein NPIL_436651 [Nephila pilipes]|uniref:OCRE domain-containing protein n=1 Tax=Nephila pilipes TaxID=299642 RepID=A0A8X6TEB7_NEPPI|nr:hypothetical protein NPIL_436651 [Nephila pilipes]